VVNVVRRRGRRGEDDSRWHKLTDAIGGHEDEGEKKDMQGRDELTMVCPDEED
jgi:hypothetical protein